MRSAELMRTSRGRLRATPKAILANLAMAIMALSAAMLAAPARADRLALPAALVDLGSPQGTGFFAEAAAKSAYWPLADEFVTQKTQAFCGVASLVMVLNALRVPAPAVADYGPFTGFTQDNLFDPATEKIVSQSYIPTHGMTLDQVAAFARHYGAAATVVHASASSVERFREAAGTALGTPGRFVIVNYLRTALGQQRYGHISPLGAYDKAADRFLILDVARYKYPPVWVRAADLFAAMNTPDAGNGGQSRGYILLGSNPP